MKQFVFAKGAIEAILAILLLLAGGAAGCGTTNDKSDTFSSGSADADRRAEKTVPGSGKGKTDKKEGTEEKRTLYDRLGGENGITAIVDDFLQRALEDPRVNWSRKGVRSGAWYAPKKSVTWLATPENIAKLKTNFVQFISLAAGGPVEYTGKPLQASHANMQIRKAEFDAAIGDLKATLDKLGTPADVQKELVAIFESTRAQITVDRR